MGKRKKQLEYPEIKLKNEKIVNIIYQSDKSLNTIAKENNITIEEIQAFLDEYHDSLDLLLEQDKQKRKDAKNLFKEIEIGLKKLRKSRPNLLSGKDPIKNYVLVNIGGKWVNPKPLKPMGKFSTIKIMNKDKGE